MSKPTFVHGWGCCFFFAFLSLVPPHTFTLPPTLFLKINVRYVPKQDGEQLVKAVRAHLAHEFGKRRSPNKLTVEVPQTGEWWLGNPSGAVFRAAGKAIEQVWGVPPIHVREGGTMPITAFLVHRLAAPALHLPLGQASDGAHLPNERIRILNLLRGKDVIKQLLLELGKGAEDAAGPAAATSTIA